MVTQRFNPSKYHYWLLSISVLLTIILFMLGWNSKGVQAEPRLAVTPTPARRPAWSSGGPSQLPRQLQQTAQVALGGGGTGRSYVCERVLAAADTPVYNIYPQYNEIFIGRPHIDAELIVGACHGIGPEPVYLVSPSGQHIHPTRSYFSVCGSGSGCYIYDFILPPDTLEGEYLLQIESEAGSFTTSLWTSVSWPPFLSITNLDMETNVSEGVVQHGQTLQLKFGGFSANKLGEAALYQEVDDVNGLSWNAIDAWQFQTNNKGEYIVKLPIPLDVDAGNYYIIACTFDSCKPALVNMGDYQDVLPPWFAWESFTISIPQDDRNGETNITAVADPVIAWNGLLLKDDPNGVHIGEIAANHSLTVFGAPVTANDGTEWIEVEDNATGRRGWVKTRYVLFDTVENTYLNLYWTPGCNPQRAEVQLLTASGQPCASSARYISLDNFADELRSINLLRQGEWLELVATGGNLNESLRIRTASNPRVGWLKIGTATPLNRQSPIGAVWRTPYNSNRLVGSVCWWRIDGEWRCEDN